MDQQIAKYAAREFPGLLPKYQHILKTQIYLQLVVRPIKATTPSALLCPRKKKASPRIVYGDNKKAAWT